jgi:hypothetical protein
MLSGTMPAISHRQAEALRALEWLLDDDIESRRSGRSTVIAIAYLRIAARRPLGTQIRVIDHHPSRDAVDTVLHYVGQYAGAAGAAVVVGQHYFFFTALPDSAIAFFENAFLETDVNPGVTQEMIAEERARQATVLRPRPRRTGWDGGPPLRQIVVNYVNEHPGLTATQIANATGRAPDAVASTLLKEVQAGRLSRREGHSATGRIRGRGAWGYYPPEPAVVGPSVWQLLRTNPYKDP